MAQLRSKEIFTSSYKKKQNKTKQKKLAALQLHKGLMVSI